MTQDGSQTEIVAQEMSQIYICQMLWGLQIESKTLATKKPTSNKQQSNNLWIYSQSIQGFRGNKKNWNTSQI